MGTTYGVITETKYGLDVIGWFRFGTTGSQISPYYWFETKEDAQNYSPAEDDDRRMEFLELRYNFSTEEKNCDFAWFHVNYPSPEMWPGLIHREKGLIAGQVSPYWRVNVVKLPVNDDDGHIEVEDCRVGSSASSYFTSKYDYVRENKNEE